MVKIKASDEGKGCMRRKLKRTAGQRRYLALRRKVAQVHSHLQNLQFAMQKADESGKQLFQMCIMQKVTEAIERLKLESL